MRKLMIEKDVMSKTEVIESDQETESELLSGLEIMMFNVEAKERLNRFFYLHYEMDKAQKHD